MLIICLPLLFMYSYANFLLQDYSLHDPPLSELGVRQCEELREHLQKDLDIAQKVELIVVSPMRRTLQTAQKALGWLMDRGVSVQLRGEWQENSDKPCDTGTPVKEMRGDFPCFDFQTVFPEYPRKKGRWAFSRTAITQRGVDCRRWLKSRPEKVIAVVSHSGFLRVGISHTKYANADYRVFQFKDGYDDELVEWDLTESRGGGMGKSKRGKAYGGPSDFPSEPELEPERETSIETKAQEEVVEEIPGGS